MEYVEGESLDAVLRARAPLPAAEWQRWLDRLLDGLEHVHGHGYVHRDITPANIVIRAAKSITGSVGRRKARRPSSREASQTPVSCRVAAEAPRE